MASRLYLYLIVNFRVTFVILACVQVTYFEETWAFTKQSTRIKLVSKHQAAETVVDKRAWPSLDSSSMSATF